MEASLYNLSNGNKKYLRSMQALPPKVPDYYISDVIYREIYIWTAWLLKGPYLGASRQDQATLAKSRLQHYAKTLYIPLLINIAIKIPAGPPELAQSQIKSGEPGAKQINSRTTPSEGLKGLLTCLLVPMDPEVVRCTG